MEIVDHPEMLAAQIDALLSDPAVVQEVSCLDRFSPVRQARECIIRKQTKKLNCEVDFFPRNSCLRAVCVTSMARTFRTGCGILMYEVYHG